MRSRGRILGLSVTVLLAVALLAPAVVLAEGVDGAEDFFAGSTYTGGSGWSGSWVEVGESDGETLGDVRLTGGPNCNGSNCVRITTLLGLIDRGLYRQIDLQGASSATLTFTYRRRAFLFAGGTVAVQARASDQDPWSGNLWSTSLTSSDPSHVSVPVPLTNYVSNATQFRLVVTAVSLNSEVYIDDVAITATYPTTTTTTSTTSSTTSTTTLPITIPTITIPTITIPTIPVPTTSTTTTSTTPTTTTSTSTTRPGAATTTTSTSGGGGGPEVRPPENPDLPVDPLTPEEVALAGDQDIAIDLASSSDFQSFGLGVNPLTDLSVALLATVETISSGIVSALLLGGVIAFFAVRRVDRDEENPQT